MPTSKKLLQPVSPQLCLLLILAAGMLARLALALSRTDMVWPDEQFQSLEPASHLVFGRAILSWEWQEAYRSWTLPLLYTPVLWLCKILGFRGGLAPIFASRFYTALLSCFALWRFRRTLELLRLRPWARVLGLASFALAMPMVLWGPATLGDNWVMITTVCILPTLIEGSRQDSPRRAFWLGLLSGLPLLLKLQAGVFAAAIGLCFLLERKPLRWLVLFGLGAASDFLALGLMDWVAYGKPFSSFLEQVRRGESISRFYGTSPWYDYFPRFVEDQGLWLPIALGAALLIALFHRKWISAFFRERRYALALALVPGLTYLAFHILIPHKETRFLLPVFPVAYLLLAIGWDGILDFFAARLPDARLQLPVAWVIPAIAAAGAGSFVLARDKPVYLTSVNIAPLEARAYELHSSTVPMKPDCVLMLEHDWSWSRGKMILGDALEPIGKHIADLPPSRTPECSYIIAPGNRLMELQSRIGGSSSWSLVKRAPNDFVLLKKSASH